MRNSFLYTAFICCILLEVLVIYSYVVKNINTKEFLLIGLSNIGVIYVFILNIRHNNKKAKTILNDKWRGHVRFCLMTLSSSIFDWGPVRQYTLDMFGSETLRSSGWPWKRRAFSKRSRNYPFFINNGFLILRFRYDLTSPKKNKSSNP